MKSTLTATINVPLGEILPSDELQKLLDRAEQDDVTLDTIMVRALRAYVDRNAPSPQALAMAG